jgi:hypothetical protein
VVEQGLGERVQFGPVGAHQLGDLLVSALDQVADFLVDELLGDLGDVTRSWE